jgi:superfamily I DNA/RNA helicase
LGSYGSRSASTFWGAGKGNIEEDNLLYVAITRAKHALYYVRTPRRQ